jgi:hypothetical protein
MTRETKAGLVVSCSFLCLVGIVLVSKLKEANTPVPDHDALAVAPADPQKVDGPTSTSSPATTGGTGSSTAGQRTDKQQHPARGVIPARFPASEDVGALVHENPSNSSTAPAAQKSFVPPAPPSTSKDVAGPVMDETTPAMEMKEKHDPPAPAVTPSQTKPPSTTPPQPKKSSILTWIPDLLKKKATSLPGMGLSHAPKTEPAGAQGLTQNSKDSKLDAANSKSAASNDARALIPLPPLPPLEAKTDATQSKPAVAAIASPAVAPPVGPLSADSGSRAPATLEQGIASGNNTAGNPATPSTAENPGPGQGARLNAPVVAPAEQSVGNNANSGASRSRNDEPAGQPRAPLGTPLPAATLPSSIPSPAADLPSSGGTQVESYDEDTYVCKATDTFASISQAVYHTEIYGQALLLFNRNHPLATENVRREPPVIQAGQPLYIPPLEILRKYYTSAIAETATGTSRPSPAASLTDAAASIRPLAVAPSATVATPAPASAQERSYRVSGNGEMLRDIARRTLGDGDRWAEIYRLNPKYDPVYPVPAGTELRLPANARVDAQSTP